MSVQAEVQRPVIAKWLFGPCCLCGGESSGYARGQKGEERLAFCAACVKDVDDCDSWALHGYLVARMDGSPHRLAIMFATRKPPGCKTDREFLAGHCNGSQFAKDEKTGDRYAEIAREEGVSITGKVYLSGLASYPGDPAAWVSGRGDVQRVCEEKGFNCSGDVTVKAPERASPPAPPPKLAPDIVESIVERKLAADPGLAVKPREELREAVIDKHGRQF